MAGEQQELKWAVGRGGFRPGAGRPRITDRRASERHGRREAFRSSEPVHVVMRCAQRVGSLRRGHLYHAIRRATATVAKRGTCRIVHASIQGNHLHLIVEAHDRLCLARGMQAFQISAAQHINRALSRRLKREIRGQVFTDRYHVVVLRSPRQVRNALVYVINNWRRHGEHRRDHARTWQVDRYASAASFDGWKEREGRPFEPPGWYQPLVTRPAKGWLLAIGWRLHGLIGLTEMPAAWRA